LRIASIAFLSTGTGVRQRGQMMLALLSSSRNRLLNVFLQLGHVRGNCVLLNKSIIESLNSCRRWLIVVGHCRPAHPDRLPS
jgi:hypothetical protein